MAQVVHLAGNDPVTGKPAGPILLSDIGKRTSQMGVYRIGQERYVKVGATLDFVTTGEVLLSADRGQIKKFVNRGIISFTP